jgi:hypothetical protein
VHDTYLDVYPYLKLSIMKYFALLFLVVFLMLGCSDGDNNYHDCHLEYASVITVDVPNEFIYGYTYRINVAIELPNSCYYYYNQYDYFYEGTSRLIYPIGHVDDGVLCAPYIAETTFSILVKAIQNEPYIFKFYQGEDTFSIIEVPII